MSILCRNIHDFQPQMQHSSMRRKGKQAVQFFLNVPCSTGEGDNDNGE